MRSSSSWRETGDTTQWDAMLAGIDGHPLQSAAWGEARREIDGHTSLYLLREEAGSPLQMARVETRQLPLLGKAAWIPRGPATLAGSALDGAGLAHELRRRGFALMITDSYAAATAPSDVHTIWIDLAQGAEALKKRIDKQWISGVRRAKREGVEVVRATTRAEVTAFHRMCEQISQAKGFELPGSETLMQQLLKSEPADGQEMQLFLAMHAGRIGAGAFVARSGRHLHYFWGASDRQLSRQRVGEAVQWAVIEWGLAEGCDRYDLEGIDPMGNPGVYAFKKKMGGEEIGLAGKEYIPLNRRGSIAFKVAKALGRV